MRSGRPPRQRPGQLGRRHNLAHVRFAVECRSSGADTAGKFDDCQDLSLPGIVSVLASLEDRQQPKLSDRESRPLEVLIDELTAAKRAGHSFEIAWPQCRAIALKASGHYARERWRETWADEDIEVAFRDAYDNTGERPPGVEQLQAVRDG